MTPHQARGVVDAARSLAPETDIDHGEWAGSGASQGSERAESFESLDFLTFVDNVTERTWRSADADFGVCVELPAR
ncbi:MAG TPA: hypothetical protein VF069_23855 [Streptosporangiaceae bacterium]